MRKFQIVSLSQYGFPQKALADNLVREHLTRRRGGKRGKRTAKQKGAPPRPPTKATEAKARRRGPQGGRRKNLLGKASKARPGFGQGDSQTDLFGQQAVATRSV